MIIKNIMNYSRNGVSDWFWQRVTAIILFAYVTWLTAYCCIVPLDYVVWRELFSHFFVKIATLLALISLLVHAWIGMWTIATDYLKPPVVRILFEITVLLALGSFLCWGIYILWS